MARRPRLELETGIFHVTSRGNNRREIFLDDADRVAYLTMLGLAVAKRDWHCLAYCLMPNHVHLLIETTRLNLGDGMRHFHGRYARSFNDRRGWDGHLFRGRFKDAPVRTDAHLWAAVGYIAQNPVKDGFCRTAEEWAWSSHGALARGSAPGWLGHERLLELLSGLGGRPERRYAESVAASIAARAVGAAR